MGRVDSKAEVRTSPTPAAAASAARPIDASMPPSSVGLSTSAAHPAHRSRERSAAPPSTSALSSTAWGSPSDLQGMVARVRPRDSRKGQGMIARVRPRDDSKGEAKG